MEIVSIFDEKILLLSPHRDDEVFGCGGLISCLMCLQKENNLLIYYFTPPMHPSSLIDNKAWERENNEAIKYMGCQIEFSKEGIINHLDVLPIFKQIKEIEDILKAFKPNTILIPFPDYDQDHERVYKAALAATRVNDRIPPVNNILLYETIGATQVYPLFPFDPNMFLPIDIKKKKELCAIYQTQIRKHRNTDTIEKMAMSRGLQYRHDCSFAEAYMVLRMAIDE